MRQKTVDGLGTKIEDFVDYWKIELGLSGWDIELRFDLSSCVADCRMIGSPEYETGRIRFNTRRMRSDGFTDKEVEAAVVHEILHLLLWEVIGEHEHDEQERNEERVVQRITRALLKY